MKTNQQLNSENRSTLPVTENGENAQTLLCRSRKLDKPYRSYRLKRRGATAVEFAIVAPIFILLVFGMIEFGRMVMVQQLLTNASREGARRAVLDGTTVQDVRDVVQQYLGNASVTIPNEDVTVSPDPVTANFGDPITVSLVVPYANVSWLPSPMFLGGTELQATTVMRRESGQ